ncbi:hypothetical protein [Streptomyces sp. NPDC050548]|uniref:hypothetical protein n=1 Tax=Streptomyces sp. NPDC050548 TaxID=3365629 RepID=UPI0037AE1FEB
MLGAHRGLTSLGGEPACSGDRQPGLTIAHNAKPFVDAVAFALQCACGDRVREFCVCARLAEV